MTLPIYTNVESNQQKQMKLKELVDSLISNKETIKSFFFPKLTRKKAKSILFGQEQGKFMTAMLELQRLHGTIISMHPESIYDENIKVKANTVFENILAVSEKNTKLINLSIEVYSIIKSETPIFAASEDYCYEKIISTDTSFTYYGLIMLVLSNCELIISFLTSLKPSEFEKGTLQRERQRGIDEIDKSLGKSSGESPEMRETRG